MKELFVSYEIASQLRDRGFDELCFKGNLTIYERIINCTEKPFYLQLPKRNSDFNNKINTRFHCTVIPLYQQVFDWFRKKDIYFIEEPHRETNPAYWLQSPFSKQGPYLIDYAIEEALKLTKTTQ